MVRGCATLVTLVPLVSQCAETQRMARGTGSSFPSWRQQELKAFSSMAFIGLPWPTKRAGWRGLVGMAVLLGRDNVKANAVR